jgi:hypothetical protein
MYHWISKGKLTFDLFTEFNDLVADDDGSEEIQYVTRLGSSQWTEEIT